MDAESIAQIEQVVTAAIGGAEGRLRQEFGEKIDAAIGGAEGRLGQEFGKKIDAAIGGAEGRLGQEFGEKIEEVKRHSGVLYEDVLRRIDLVVEGHQGLRQGLLALREQVKDLDAKIEHESLETRALIQLSYRQLQDRVDTLERRVQIIEKRIGLAV